MATTPLPARPHHPLSTEVTAGGSYPLGSSYHAFTSLLHSLLSLAIIRPCSSSTPLSFRLFLIPSPQVILGFPLFLTPLVLDPVILLTILPSSILSTCPNHLNPFCSALFDSSNKTPVRRRISSFLILSHLVTPHILLRHLISITSRSFLSSAFIPQVSAAYSA